MNIEQLLAWPAAAVLPANFAGTQCYLGQSDRLPWQPASKLLAARLLIHSIANSSVLMCAAVSGVSWCAGFAHLEWQQESAAATSSLSVTHVSR